MKRRETRKIPISLVASRGFTVNLPITNCGLGWSSGWNSWLDSRGRGGQPATSHLSLPCIIITGWTENNSLSLSLSPLWADLLILEPVQWCPLSSMYYISYSSISNYNCSKIRRVEPWQQNDSSVQYIVQKTVTEFDSISMISFLSRKIKLFSFL